MDTLQQTAPQHAGSTSALLRWLPLTGVAYAVLTVIGNLVIGDFPDGGTSASALVRYYATHHAQVGHGGQVLGIATICYALFVAALVVRTVGSPVAAAVIAVGGAADIAHTEWSAASYALMGSLPTEHGVTPQALQAWHIAGAEFGLGPALAALMIGVFLAAVTTRAIPVWLGWSALVLGVAQLAPAPWGFWAMLLTVLWSLVAGIVLAVRRTGSDPAAG